MKPLLQSKPRPSNFKPVLLNSECSSRLILNLFSLGHHSNSVRDNRHVKKQNSAVGLLSNHQDAEVAVKELQKSGYNMNKLSVIGKDYHTEENIFGHYNAGDRMATWGKFGVFWGTIWGTVVWFGIFYCSRTGAGYGGWAFSQLDRWRAGDGE